MRRNHDQVRLKKFREINFQGKNQQRLSTQADMAKENTTSAKSKAKAGKNILERINPNAAEVDAGANFHSVAIPEDRAEEPIRKFGPFTSDLQRLADWLKVRGLLTATTC